ncbi:hypothetical protein ACFC6U_19380 [Kitasatospora purpeofusca]|uniref:hypothetical protein n=1 Tax=Kitasatospora purpeofusca TaxID=67352 RepID=UPI0035D56116
MLPSVRSVTGCLLPAAQSTTRRTRHRPPHTEFVLYTCDRHARALTAGGRFGGRTLLTRTDDGQQRGTMIDHRPAERVVANHFRLWLGTGTPVVDGREVPWRDWVHELRGHYEYSYLERGGRAEIADHLDRALSVAERAQAGDHTEEQLAAVLDALAAAEHL